MLAALASRKEKNGLSSLTKVLCLLERLVLLKASLKRMALPTLVWLQILSFWHKVTRLKAHAGRTGSLLVPTLTKTSKFCVGCAQFTNHVRIHYLETTPETAESIKYMANSLLLTYISYWNGVGGRLAESFDNIHMEDLKRGVTSDNRISTWGSYVSNGAGGSRFEDIQSPVSAEPRWATNRPVACRLQHQ